MRVCPECDCEYVARAERCSDCGVALIDRSEVDAEAGGSAPPPLPAGDYRALVRREVARELDPLAAALGGAGVPFKVEVRAGFGFELCVRDDERAGALALLREFLPELDSGEPPADAATEAADERCPACDTVLPAQAPECPECGLGLAVEGA